MTKIITSILCVVLLFNIYLYPIHAFSEQQRIGLTEKENAWLEQNRNNTFKLGINLFSGMHYFKFNGEVKGYIIDCIQKIEKDLGIKIELVISDSWDEVKKLLINGEIDILFGANVTDERLNYMYFTKPIFKYPYAIFGNKKSAQIQTIGDFDGKDIGFIKNDMIIEMFSNLYNNINFNVIEFDNQDDALQSLDSNKIDGFIASGGGIVYEFLYKYKHIKYITKLEDITSNMTLSTRKENEILGSILDKVIENNLEHEFTRYINKAIVEYNRKILGFSEAELNWLKNDGKVIVGVTNDYLPFEYYDDGDIKGINGEIIKEIKRITGIEFEFVSGEFTYLYNKAVNGEIDIINIAKTKERMDKFIFPRTVGPERDIIIGKRKSKRVQDIYGLEGKTVVVINGFWHDSFLRKNLRNVNIIYTKNIQDSLKVVNSNKAEYLIENPTVAEFYISGLGYNNLVKRGNTSKNSHLYLGINKNKPELASILDKTIGIIDLEEMKYRGLETVPSLVPIKYTRLISIVIFLFVLIICIIILLIRQIVEKNFLKEKEYLMYIDPLTGVYNRLYFNHVIDDLDYDFPQCIIVTDINDLKYINDFYGHHTGDDVIIKFSEILKKYCKDDLVFRVGGDEFIIILKRCNNGNLENLIEQIKNECNNTIINMERENITIVASFGYEIRYSKDDNINEVIKIADKNMYIDKDNYKNNKRRRHIYDKLLYANKNNLGR